MEEANDDLSNVDAEFMDVGDSDGAQCESTDEDGDLVSIEETDSEGDEALAAAMVRSLKSHRRETLGAAAANE